MEKSKEYASFKKVLIFGAVGVGKTTLTNYIENDTFSEESPTEDSKL